ncbi:MULTISPECIES: TonB-dependent receptor [unclassified Leptospira]|uniref:TonB-dependent receptor n=1 Tax=unclassified Leptospira TaxID=2633828 RepID=UPI0002C00870|nr:MULTISPECIES: TonB-dependent receptor [unclassified Leptospira]EMK02016.1 TonB-dependent receptor plug domain protein [Leptospira sp. B5-022]MCR1795164.1 TonB-dependent receptor [Leptospira sp. id769339]
MKQNILRIVGLGISLSYFVCASLSPILSQDQETKPTNGKEKTDTEKSEFKKRISEYKPDTIVIRDRRSNLIGIASSASEGVVGSDQIKTRPIMRQGEVAELIPGAIVTQHSGGGKANQFFLRGFNLDHGTDLSSNVDGMPVNNVSHAHGQGYTDLNFLIPELVEQIQYKKGVYYADQGDFASAGAFNISYFKSLVKGIANVEGGTLGYARTLIAKSHKLGPGDLLYAFEASHNDGPWVISDNFRRVNGVTSYSVGNKQKGFSIGLMGYKGSWHSTGQAPKRALRLGDSWLEPDSGLSRFESVDHNDGGWSNRASINFEAHRSEKGYEAKTQFYGIYYDLRLFSNFTYYLDDPERGDQHEQADRRTIAGSKSSYKDISEFWGIRMENTIGLQIRRDYIQNGLFHTEKRARLETVREDGITQLSSGLYYENKMQWANKFRTVFGIRGDYYTFNVDDWGTKERADRNARIYSPKGSIIIGPWCKIELYISGGYGFHSNDARGVVQKTDPANPLVQTRGGEVGIRTEPVHGWQSTFSVWQLDMNSELLFTGDNGTTEASRPSTRKGIEWANYYSYNSWLMIDADFATSKSRFRDDDPSGNYIPGSIRHTLASGITLKNPDGFFGSLRVRYFGNRSLIEDNTVRSPASTTVNFQFGRNIGEDLSIVFEVFNLLNAHVSDIDYYYASRLKNEPVGPNEGGYNDIHTHPALPRSIRISVRASF